MSRLLKLTYLFLSLSLVAAVASPQQRLEGDPGLDDVVKEDFDSYGLRWQPLLDFERATLRIAGRHGLVWERQFLTGEELDYDLFDSDGVLLEDGSYTYEWRATTLPHAEEPRVMKVQNGRFQILDGAAQSLKKPSPGNIIPFSINSEGNHFVGPLTTDTSLCAGCSDGDYASVAYVGDTENATIRSKGTFPAIVIHEDSPYKELWSLTSDYGEFLIRELPTGPEIGGVQIPFSIQDRTPSGTLHLSSSGNVGIGNSMPLASLHVTKSDGTTKVLVEEFEVDVAVRTMFQLMNTGAPRFALTNKNTGVEWSFQQSSPGNFLISREGTGGPEMQVYSSGRVRMGPGGAASFDLTPAGNLTIAGSLTANGSVFPDYVFEPDYDLMPLSDLKDFVRQEKRLPDIPSAEEVQKQGGHNMTELQIKLLEKIEELTLYTLEQQEEIASLKARLAEMAIVKAELAEIRAMLSER